MINDSLITQKEVKELFNYDPNTGEIKWKVNRGHKIKAGDIAGSISKNGYRNIMIDGINFKAHRLAWLYVYGKLPEESLDHINRDKLDNRITNLRVAGKIINSRNTDLRSDNSSGITGVTFDKSRDKWIAQIIIRGKNIHLGRFSNIKQAAQARLIAENHYGWH